MFKGQNARKIEVLKVSLKKLVFHGKVPLRKGTKDPETYYEMGNTKAFLLAKLLFERGAAKWRCRVVTCNEAIREAELFICICAVKKELATVFAVYDDRHSVVSSCRSDGGVLSRAHRQCHSLVITVVGGNVHHFSHRV